MFRKLVAAIFLLGSSNFAYALINAEVFYGLNWYNSKNADDSNFASSGKSLSLGLHLDPIPLVPFSIGANYMAVNLKKSDFGNAGSAQIYQIGIDVKAWAPMVPVVTPYVRLRYIANSKLRITYDDGTKETNTRLKGYLLGLGMDYKIVPMVHAMLEYSQSFEKADDFAGKKQNFNSKILSIGLQVGI